MAWGFYFVSADAVACVGDCLLGFPIWCGVGII